jgi:hypothetical protein
MSTKPGNYLNWIPSGSSSYISQPSSGQLTTGWIANEAPPFQYLNWLFYYIDQWIQWFDFITTGSNQFEVVTGNTTCGFPITKYFCNTASAGFTMTLPAAASNGGVSFELKNSSFTSGNNVTVARTGSDDIEGGTSDTIAPGEYRKYTSDGVSNWFMMNP